jgi:hypothetical protein
MAAFGVGAEEWLAPSLRASSISGSTRAKPLLRASCADARRTGEAQRRALHEAAVPLLQVAIGSGVETAACEGSGFSRRPMRMGCRRTGALALSQADP